MQRLSAGVVVLWSAGCNRPDPPARCECPVLIAIFCSVLSRPQAFSHCGFLTFTCPHLQCQSVTAASLSAAAAGDRFGKQNDEEKERLVYFSPKDRLWSGVLYLDSATLRLMFFISWFADVHL